MRDRLRAAIWLAMSAASAALGQSYGDRDQTLTIGAADFQIKADASDDFLDADGYLYGPTASVYYDYRAPLTLPEGALIEQVCLYVNDSDPSRVAGAYLMAQRLVPGGGTPGQISIQGSAALSSSDIGYGYYCSDPLAYTLLSTFEMGGDGTLDNVAWYVAAYFSNAVAPSDSSGVLGLGGVRITWKRQVSPPPDTPTFADVPATDRAWHQIEALAASGITAGCGGGNYCPDGSLTRRQMAVFLAKALGLQWSVQ